MKHEESAMIVTRREFCVRTSQAVSLITVNSLSQACGGSPTAPSNVPQLSSVSASQAGNVITINIDSSSPLAAAGGAASVRVSNGTFLVARTGQSAFIAVTAICTHEQCTITGFDSLNYVCPCHGSMFSTSGSVVKGPASSSLRQFATSFANGVLTISV